MAQDVPIVQAGAGGRYERQIDPRTAVPGVQAASMGQFRAGVDAVTAQLAAMPEVHAPPSPVCHRLKTFIETTRPHNVLSASISVMSPINFNNGRCHSMTGGGVEIYLNRLDVAFERNRALVPNAEEGRSNWFAMPYERVAADRYKLADGTLIVTNGRPFMNPVSADRYAREQVRLMGEDGSAGRNEWTNLLATLTPEQRGRPACLSPSMTSLSFAGSCPPERRVWEIHPDYFDPRNPGKLQLMILKTPQRAYHGESRERYAARLALWSAIDVDRLTALLAG